MQVWQPWRKISTEWPQVLLSESKTFCKIKRSFRDFFTRKCSTGSVECSLNNPVAGFPARRPKLFGSDSHIHFKKQISERKFLPKSSTGHQNLKCSQAWKIYITKTDKKNCWTSFTKKKNFHRKHFSSLSRMENDKPAAEKTRQVSKNVPASVSKKLFDWSFWEQNIFRQNCLVSSRTQLQQSSCSFSKKRWCFQQKYLSFKLQISPKKFFRTCKMQFC